MPQYVCTNGMKPFIDVLIGISQNNNAQFPKISISFLVSRFVLRHAVLAAIQLDCYPLAGYKKVYDIFTNILLPIYRYG